VEELSQIDLAFCIDLTRSMQPFIDAAKRHVMTILGGLREAARADLRVGIVGYRDHDPAPNHRPVEVYPFTAKDAETRKSLGALSVGSLPSNTDAAEAVFAGLDAAGRELAWRQGAFRIIVLVGDGPPHGCKAVAEPYPDRYPDQDPTGHSLASLAELLERAGVFVYALGMVPSSLPSHDNVLEASFSQLAQATGGFYRAASSAADAIAVVEAIGQRVFGQMSIDRALYEKLMPTKNVRSRAPRAVTDPNMYASRSMDAMPMAPSAFAPGAPPPPAAAAPMPRAEPIVADEELAAAVDMPAEDVKASLARLQKRGLL